MGRFDPDLANVRAGFRPLDSGEWELTLGKPKVIFYFKEGEDGKDGHDVAGALIPMLIVAQIKSDGSLDDEFEGDGVAPMRLYVHTDKAFGMTKQFLLAALGFRIDEEDLANDEVFAKVSFGVDVDDDDQGVLGDGWHLLEGKRVRLTASTGLYNDRPSQNYSSYVPMPR